MVHQDVLFVKIVGNWEKLSIVFFNCLGPELRKFISGNAKRVQIFPKQGKSNIWNI